MGHRGRKEGGRERDTGGRERETTGDRDLRVERQPDTAMLGEGAPGSFRSGGGASTRSASPSSTKSIAATSAGTPHTRWHTSSAGCVLQEGGAAHSRICQDAVPPVRAGVAGAAPDLTKSRLPHWPTAPRLVTSAPMVTYSRYGPTGEASYSKLTTPPAMPRIGQCCALLSSGNTAAARASGHPGGGYRV